MDPVEGDIATVGITDYAQEQLGDVVFVELPEVGKQARQGEQAAVVESVKAASEVYAPVAGEVVEVNEAWPTTRPLVNEDAEGEAGSSSSSIADAARARRPDGRGRLQGILSRSLH